MDCKGLCMQGISMEFPGVKALDGLISRCARVKFTPLLVPMVPGKVR